MLRVVALKQVEISLQAVWSDENIYFEFFLLMFIFNISFNSSSRKIFPRTMNATCSIINIYNYRTLSYSDINVVLSTKCFRQSENFKIH
jgi:hypothetical protein